MAPTHSDDAVKRSGPRPRSVRLTTSAAGALVTVSGLFWRRAPSVFSGGSRVNMRASARRHSFSGGGGSRHPLWRGGATERALTGSLAVNSVTYG